LGIACLQTLPLIKKNKKMNLLQSASKIISIAVICLSTGRLQAQVEPEIETVAPEELIEESPTSPNDVLYFAEVMPVFPGGDEGQQKFISSNISYPVEAKKKKVTGKVFVSFIVEKDGTTSGHKISRGIQGEEGKLMNDEVLRVAKLLTGYKPGMQKGQPVRVQMTVPVVFSL